jgi:transposase
LPLPALLPESARLALQRVRIDGEAITLAVQVIASTSQCPRCGQPSTRVHSRYVRTLADLPCQGKAVHIRLHVRRFFCPATDCPQKTFAERLPEVAAVSARTTARLQEAHRLIGQSLGGEAGARLAAPLGMPTSPDTLLRRVRRAPLPRSPAVRVVGIDDWAWRKGQRYGTILCDLERRRPVDLLPERSADSLSCWLKEHPEVEIISRDRGDEYIKGASQGAPQAVQVGQGVSLRAIARRMGMHRGTVRRWLRAGSFPERAQRRATSRTDPFVDYLRRRWDEGCHNAARLTEEIRVLGFRGSYLMVRRCVARWRRGGPERGQPSRPEPALKRPSSRRVSWWLLTERAELEPEEQALLQVLWDRCPELKTAAELAREFADMVRRRRSGEWDSWMASVQGPGVARELRSFAEGLRQDEAAVRAALSLEWSNGPVKGQINRLKTLKRQMYGRAGFDLLRRRFLQAG